MTTAGVVTAKTSSTVTGLAAISAETKDGGSLSTTSRLYLFGYDYSAVADNETRANGYCVHCASVLKSYSCTKCEGFGWWTIRRDLVVPTYLDEKNAMPHA